MIVLDMFAGPGGWEEGLSLLGLDRVSLGLDLDLDACRTARAAGHLRAIVDLGKIDPLFYACHGLIASPPCQGFSQIGTGEGRQDFKVVSQWAHEVCYGFGEESKEDRLSQCADPRSLLVVEPLRWARFLRPEWVVLEQVPTVLPLWEEFAPLFQKLGYQTWTGCLQAEGFGVPQTRKRAFLIADTKRQPSPPDYTHNIYNSFEDPSLKPWISMAERLGWSTFGYKAKYPWCFNRPAPTIVGKDRVNRPDQRRKLGQESVRITPSQAGVLQGFRADYPWYGSATSQYQQIGNAVPPPMAAAVLSSVVA